MICYLSKQIVVIIVGVGDIVEVRLVRVKVAIEQEIKHLKVK